VAKIRDIAIEVFARQWDGPSTEARSRQDQPAVQHYGLLSVKDDDGTSGECMFGGGSAEALGATTREILACAEAELIGRSIFDREWLWQRSRALFHYSRLTPSGWAALDIALWDLAGKRAGLPVYELLGAAHEHLTPYVSSAYHPDLTAYADEASYWAEQGIPAYKPHPGGRAVKAVCELTSLVRSAVGDDPKLMLDCSGFYSGTDAVAIGRHIHELGYLWIEDPVHWGHSRILDDVARRLDIAVAATDTPLATFDFIPNLVDRNSPVQIVRGGAQTLGITGLRRAAALTEGLGRAVELHVGSTLHLNLANLHVAFATPSCSFVELVYPADWVQWGTSQPITPGPDGLIAPPPGPGLGAQLDNELLARSHVATKTSAGR
jgi:L-alanine-DL-glutamate epimerase-like enolase superfamily enzyme